VGLGGRRAERTVAIPLVKNVKVIGLAVIAIYAFSISFALSRYMPHGIPFSVPNTRWLATEEGLVNGVLLGPFWPVTMLTPAIIVMGIWRFSTKWALCYVGVGYVAGNAGWFLGYTGHSYIDPVWILIISACINIPLLAVWTVLISGAFKRSEGFRAR
jgi:hypothetical protein